MTDNINVNVEAKEDVRRPFLSPQDDMPPAQNTEETSKKTAVADSPIKFDSQALVQGIVFSEILGKPKAKRRVRW